MKQIQAEKSFMTFFNLLYKILDINIKQRSGRKMPRRKVNNLKIMFGHEDGISQRQAAHTQHANSIFYIKYYKILRKKSFRILSKFYRCRRS